MDWNHVRAFLETVERGSLTGAARALNLTQPTVGRQIAALEERLGVLLFDRIGKSLSLTPGGLDLLEHARVMGKAIADLQIAATGQATSIEGRVSITASDLVCPYLATFLHDLKALVPGIEVHIVAANELRDIRRREADIAIRHVRPEQPELIARAMPSRRAHLYAATRYLNRHGHPKKTKDLAKAVFIGFDGVHQLLEALTAMGAPVPVSDSNIGPSSDNGMVVWELMKQGFGIGVALADTAALSPELEPVLPARLTFPIPIWLTAHQELLTSRRIRLVFDFLADKLQR